MENKYKCWDFVMSSLARTYGISKVKSNETFHSFALEWCDEHNYICDIFKSLNEVDNYFQQEYEKWEY